MEPVEITAGRLHLRPWAPPDEDVLFEGSNDPLIQRWTRVPTPYTRELARERIASATAGWNAGTSLGVVVEGPVGGEVVEGRAEPTRSLFPQPGERTG